MTKPLSGTETKRLNRQWRRRTEQRLALILDGVQNPFNLGSILRSAAAYGVVQIWLTPQVPSPTDAKVDKTALGSQRFLTWSQVPGVLEAVDQARLEGFRTVAVELCETAVPLHDVDLHPDICLIVGHEDRGVTREGLQACDQIGYLPMVGRIGSLNVATATAIAMAETRRQGWDAMGTTGVPGVPGPEPQG